MKKLTIIALVCGLALTGCSKDPDPDGGAAEFHVSLTEPADGDDSALADGEGVEIAAAVESREALLVTLTGIPSPPQDEPLKFELVRVVDSEVHVDVDAEDGPEQWITIAEVQDSDGNVLWSDRVNSLFQLLEYLEVIMNQQSDLNFGITQVFSFVLMQYPQLLEFGVKVPLGIEGGAEYVLKIPKEDGTYFEAFRASIDDLVAAKEAPSVAGEVSTILDNGDPQDKIDLVILGDGYTADEREKFELDAQAIADRFAAAEPFKTKLNDFNIHTVWVASEESGAGYDCTGNVLVDGGCKRDLRDTVFQTVFVLTALADRFMLALEDTSDRVAMPLAVGRLFEAASAAPFDEIVMISNTKRTSGFAGLYVSVLTAYDSRVGFPDTAVHELGHSFGVLGDEYNIEGDPCLLNEPAIPLPANIAATAVRDEIKWSHLVDEDVSLPTSRAEGENGEVGAFTGAYNCDELFRPVYNCKMRDSDEEFCPVCSEQLVNRIYAYVDPMAHNSTATATRVGDELVFAVTPRDDTMNVQWLLDDAEVGEGAELRLGADALPTAWSKLTARVHDASGYVVGDRPRTQADVEFWIRR